jgi:hypothetical protein
VHRAEALEELHEQHVVQVPGAEEAEGRGRRREPRQDRVYPLAVGGEAVPGVAALAVALADRLDE